MRIMSIFERNKADGKSDVISIQFQATIFFLLSI